MLHIAHTEIRLGLEKPLTVCHITDLHLEHADGRDDLYAREYAASRVPFFPRFSASERDMKAYLRKNRPDFLLLTGDIVDDPTDVNLEAMDALIEAAGCPYMYVPGNHDWSLPKDYQSDEQVKKMLPRLKRFCGGDTAFQAREYGGIMWIGVDDSRRDSVSDEQADKTEQALLEAKKRGLPAVVAVHIPIKSRALTPEADRVWPFRVMIGYDDSDEATKRFCRIVTEKAAAVMAGHVHFTHDARLDDSECTQYITALGAEGHVRILHIV